LAGLRFVWPLASPQASTLNGEYVEIERVKIVPTCRYGHGPLHPAAHNEIARWAYVAGTGDGLCFTGDLFVCPKCGYSEFFDDAFGQAAEAERNPA
jgi:hypothetical protein